METTETPDLRRAGGTEKRRWAGTARGGRFGNLFFALLARRGGLAVATFFLFWVALYFIVAAPNARRASFEFADRVGRGGSLWRRLFFTFRHFFTFGLLQFESMAILEGHGSRYEIEHEGSEVMRAAIAQGKGTVLLTAHFGNWLAMGHLLERYGAPVTVVMFDGIQPRMKATIEKIRSKGSFSVLYTDGSPASAATILKALSEGHVVGMMGDRLLSSGVTVDFLGGPVCFPAGPFALSLAAGAPLLHVFAVRTGRRRYAFRGVAAEFDRLGGGTRKERIQAGIAEFARSLEELVLRHPEQWANFHSLWEETEGAREEAEGGSR